MQNAEKFKRHMPYFSIQASQTRTSFPIPNLGRVHSAAKLLEEYLALQWCFHWTMPNSTRHLWQHSPSAHSGAWSATNIASSWISRGNLAPSAFMMLITYIRNIPISNMNLYVYMNLFLARNTLDMTNFPIFTTCWSPHSKFTSPCLKSLRWTCRFSSYFIISL